MDKEKGRERWTWRKVLLTEAEPWGSWSVTYTLQVLSGLRFGPLGNSGYREGAPEYSGQSPHSWGPLTPAYWP